MDLNILIGQRVEVACKKIKEFGYNDIEVKLNAKHDDRCNSTLVCSVRESDGKVTLICGEFITD